MQGEVFVREVPREGYTPVCLSGLECMIDDIYPEVHLPGYFILEQTFEVWVMLVQVFVLPDDVFTVALGVTTGETGEGTGRLRNQTAF